MKGVQLFNSDDNTETFCIFILFPFHEKFENEFKKNLKSGIVGNEFRIYK